jgi:flagellar protein FlaJ
MIEPYKALAVRLFGRVSERSLEGFSGIRPYLRGAGMDMMLNTWVSVTLLTTSVAYVAALASMLLLGALMGLDALTFTYSVIFGPVMAASFVFVFMYALPIQRSANRKNSINNNLPFALSHMSAIASAGLPPEFMFELLMGFKEYGEISRQSGLVVRNIKTFGMSSVDALKNVEDSTPSADFRQILAGIRSTIEKGGSLTKYLQEMADRAFFDYRLKRESFLKTLSTYSDIYTAVMITAPLMMLIVLASMSAIGADVFGMAIGDVLFLMTWVLLPVMNVVFLAFLHMTYPET